jgi:hypothetical protein
VKLLPPAGFDPNQPQSYGVLTQAAIALPEIQAPERTRVYCMAVTNDNVSGATASGWSAAIDQAAAGRMIADDDGEQENEDGAEAARPSGCLLFPPGMSRRKPTTLTGAHRTNIRSKTPGTGMERADHRRIHRFHQRAR